MLRFASTISLGFLLLGSAAACDVGGVGGDDSAGDDTAGDDDGMPGPADPILCATKYGATGDVGHNTVPEVGGSCDPGGTWTIALATPVADSDGHDLCAAAPESNAFTINVTVIEVGTYEVADAEDATREWSFSVSDKSGSCSGSFQYLTADGIWSWHAVEAGADGALAGQGNYEERME